MTEEKPASPNIEQRAFEASIKHHDFVRLLIAETYKSTIGAAASALRVLLTINAGGTIALLGFIGAIAGKEKHVFPDATVFVQPMSLFGLGVILAAAATCSMYCAQGLFGIAASSIELSLNHPYTKQTSRSKLYRLGGTIFQITAILSALISFALFVRGLYSCREIILMARL